MRSPLSPALIFMDERARTSIYGLVSPSSSFTRQNNPLEAVPTIAEAHCSRNALPTASNFFYALVEDL